MQSASESRGSEWLKKIPTGLPGAVFWLAVWFCLLLALRLIPGAQVTQTGQVGGTTGLSIRGGNVNANKVLINLHAGGFTADSGSLTESIPIA